MRARSSGGGRRLPTCEVQVAVADVFDVDAVGGSRCGEGHYLLDHRHASRGGRPWGRHSTRRGLCRSLQAVEMEMGSWKRGRSPGKGFVSLAAEIGRPRNRKKRPQSPRSHSRVGILHRNGAYSCASLGQLGEEGPSAEATLGASPSCK